MIKLPFNLPICYHSKEDLSMMSFEGHYSHLFKALKVMRFGHSEKLVFVLTMAVKVIVKGFEVRLEVGTTVEMSFGMLRWLVIGIIVMIEVIVESKVWNLMSLEFMIEFQLLLSR